MSNVTALPTPANDHPRARVRTQAAVNRLRRAWRVLRGLVEALGWSVLIVGAVGAYLQMP